MINQMKRRSSNRNYEMQLFGKSLDDLRRWNHPLVVSAERSGRTQYDKIFRRAAADTFSVPQVSSKVRDKHKVRGVNA
jgi:hypothetical protein